MPCPLVTSDRIISLGDRGELICLELATGDTVWEHQLGKSRSKYYSSPVLAGDVLYCLREDGLLTIGQVGDDYTLLDEHEFGEQCVATPIPLRDGLLIRTAERLIWLK